ncbi:uncharacterized protein LOC128550541 [Mercenaria mercenaria]|uniref:uncharacterized protein LOC128550541 n=1 Tax=Mercenaria mercenaria TaxID=6596 RepID=UPI00234E9530|nr:uncharacterized protein LOC128550541 [Mercenaria mercenaria]
MRCPNCEVESGPGTKFCPECGKGLLPLTSAKTCQSKKNDGTICGQVLQDGIKFCPSCGKPVEKIVTCRHCNSNLGANSSFCQNCGKPVLDTKKEIPEQDIQQRQGDLVAPSEEIKEPGSSNEEEFGSIPFIDADEDPETIPKGTEHDDNDSSQSEEEEWFDAINEVDETNEEGQETQDSPRPKGEDERKQELQLQQPDDHTPQKDANVKTKKEMPIESAITEKNSEDEFQHVEITPSKKANVSTENFGNQYKQPAMGFETDVDSFQQSMIYQAVEENWIRINFHALIAPNMKFDHQTDIVVLHMWTKNGNGGAVQWNKPMTFEGTHLEAQGVAEVKFEVDLPKSDVFNARISYKYFVERNSEKHDGTKRKSVWECLYGNKSDNDRRQLHVDKSSEGLGILVNLNFIGSPFFTTIKIKQLHNYKY